MLKKKNQASFVFTCYIHALWFFDTGGIFLQMEFVAIN